ncbi:hypothetical protein [Dyella sp.]|uniref:hypothetical protein n=1 Tax=Dyella sp. TaxID=1869338 RepID=UPI002D78B550|nr:hypothetical protein [Dyella sp.]HET7331973.1 hypothetical protein [Dyella sp.]
MKSPLMFLSPGRILLMAGTLLIGFTFMPPGMYEAYIMEPDYMFGNLVLYLFIAGSLLVLWASISISVRLPAIRTIHLKKLMSVGPFFYLFGPVACALALLAITIWSVLQNDSSIFGLLLARQGQEVKQAMVIAGQGAFNGSLPLAMGVSWWALDRYLELRQYMSHARLITLSALVGALVIVLLLTATLMLSRFVVMPTLFGLFLVYIRHKIVRDRVKAFSIVRRALLALASILALFWLFASLRNAGDKNAIVQSFVGYGPGALNHLAALLAGRLNVDALNGYLRQENFGFFYKFPFMIRLFDLTDVFISGTESMFDETWRGGLNGAYIWITSFGEIAAQLRGFAVVYLFGYGYIVARAWRSFIRGGIFGTIMYPWAAFGVLFSFGSNFFASNFLSILMILTLILGAYGGLVNVKQGAHRSAARS